METDMDVLPTHDELRSHVLRAALAVNLTGDVYRQNRTRGNLAAKITAGKALIRANDVLEDYYDARGGRDSFFEDMRDEDEDDE